MSRWRPPVQVTTAYLAVALAWILLSDRAVAAVTQGAPGVEALLQTTKGAAFVLVTGAVLLVVLERSYRADRALLASLEDRDGRLRYQAEILGRAQDAITVTDGDRRFVYWNAAAERLYGFAAEAALGRTMAELTQYQILDADGETAPLSTVATGGTWRGDARVRRSDGQTIRIEATISPIKDVAGGLGRISIARDVTDVRHQADTLATLLRASPLPVILIGADRRIEYWNAAAERLFGYSADEMIGTRSTLTPVADRASLRDALTRLRHGDSVVLEARRRIRDGQEIPVRIFASPVVDKVGERASILAFVEDLRERERLEADLRQAQKMEAIGRLAGGIAHDFNNILTAIAGYARLVERSMAEAGQNVDDVREIVRSSDRATGLTRQLLAFSRRGPVRAQVLDLGTAVAEVVPMIHRLIGDRADIVTALQPCGRIVGDPTEIEQVLLNLVINAVDAMPTGGRVTISTRPAHPDEIRSFAAMATERGTSRTTEAIDAAAALTVTDEGIGMDDDVKARVFEPFFTTKPEGRGTGLGLASVYGIVARSGGAILIDSAPAHGSTFTIVLPLAVGAPDDPPDNVGVTDAVRSGSRGQRVLLVEDDEAVRQLTGRWLVDAGYVVVPAVSGGDVLARVASAAIDLDAVDLIVTDVMMPGMTGPRLLAQLHAIRPGLPVVYMSGFVADIAQNVLPQGAGFVHKPMTAEALHDAVAAVLKPA